VGGGHVMWVVGVHSAVWRASRGVGRSNAHLRDAEPVDAPDSDGVPIVHVTQRVGEGLQQALVERAPTLAVVRLGELLEETHAVRSVDEVDGERAQRAAHLAVGLEAARRARAPVEQHDGAAGVGRGRARLAAAPHAPAIVAEALRRSCLRLLLSGHAARLLLLRRALLLLYVMRIAARRLLCPVVVLLLLLFLGVLGVTREGCRVRLLVLLLLTSVLRLLHRLVLLRGVLVRVFIPLAVVARLVGGVVRHLSSSAGVPLALA
jgi:hypothetical protein